MSTAIYDRVKALCRERGISVMQLSLDAGLHEDTIRFWGRGQGKPRASTVKLVADRLGVTPTYLRYGDVGEVAERIRLLRLKNGMSCVALADAIGCSPDSIYNWEHGKVMPREDFISDLAAFFGVSFRYLRYGKGDESK